MNGPTAGTPVVERPRPAVDPWTARPFRVRRRRQDTADTTTLWLEPLDGVPMAFEAGQFTMIGVLGAGEAPISISGDPGRPELLRHTIRDVGGVTHLLAGARPGDLLDVRGPYGRGWSVRDGEGGDVLIVAGGIGLAPLRPVVWEIAADRGRFRDVAVRYGARTPADLLYGRGYDDWRAHGVDVSETVDHAPRGYRGRVGPVTTLITAEIDPENTLALVCGPEVMMRHAASALVRRGVPPGRVRLSMERNMACGVGLCGHCQLRELFVCTDGPVLPWSRLEPLLRLREV